MSLFKVCSKCGESKLLDEFRVRKDTGKHRNACKVCENSRQRKYAARPENVEAYKTRRQRYTEEGRVAKWDSDKYLKRRDNGKLKDYLDITQEDRRIYEANRHTNRLDARLWQSAKSRAETKNLPFNLEVSDIKIPNLCPVLKIPLYSGAGMGGIHDGSPTLDRKVPHLGYVKGNVKVISSLANRIKSNATSAQIQEVADYVRKIEEENI